jgi:hypothetical protein
MIKDKIREWLGITALETNTTTRYKILRDWITAAEERHDALEKLTDDAFKEQIQELDLIWEELDKLDNTIFGNTLNEELKAALSTATKTKTKTKKTSGQK